MSRLLISLVAAVAGMSVAHSQVSWRTNLAEAKAEAIAAKKPLLVYFTTDWCGWCKVMERETFQDAKVTEQSNRFIPLKLDAEKAGMALAKKLKVNSYPAFFFLDADEKVIGSILGYRDHNSWQSRVNAVLGGGSEKDKLQSAVQKDAKDGESRARLAQIYVIEQDMDNAKKWIAEAEKLSYKGSDLAVAYCQMSEALAPQDGIPYLKKAIALRDKSTLSVAYERLMNAAAMTGNLELMKSTALDAFKEEDVSPALKRRVEPVAKGGTQMDRLRTPEDVVKELQVQISAVENRDDFYFRHLFLEGASLNYIAKFGEQVGQIIVSVDTFHQVMATDRLKTSYKFAAPRLEKTLDMATATFEFATKSTTEKGDVLEGQGTMIAVLVRQGSRWCIQSLAMQAKPSIAER